MKRLLAVTLLLISGSLCVYAQQEDTIKVRIPSKIAFQHSDSLLQDKSRLQLLFTQPDYNRLNGNMQGLINERLFSSKQMPGTLNSACSKLIVPATLISYGLITRGNKPLQQLDYSTHHEISEHLKVPIPIDDYSQFVPAGAVYGLDFVGIKGKHNFRDRTVVMATSYIIMGATVQTMKIATKIERPDGSNTHSFPSGHTASAFVGAQILFREYKDASLWIGVAGYAVAAGTGTLRVLNKKHWVSDVVTGAGIGILSAEAGYMLLPVFHKITGVGDKNKNLVVAPSIGTANYGVDLAYTF